MTPARVSRVLSSALALTVLALPLAASSMEVMPQRADLPDAVLRDVTHVVCVTYPEELASELAVYSREGGDLRRTGVIPRAQTGPVSRWDDDDGWKEDCFPAYAEVRVLEVGGDARYAHVLLDVQVRDGRKVWLREGSERGPDAPWVTIESVRTLEAFEDKRIDFLTLRLGDQPLVVRAEPRDEAKELPTELPVDTILGQRVGDYAEVLSYTPGQGGYVPLGWVRVVDARGLLLLWPTHFPRHGC
ncbi:hypothetical protein [Pyxidicoccus xibeiensis]|uniref:hypothetical protein n=1 Tax=Pyxidicoccus xibeiensis TaxID=2906759 RepID=UPI0020A82015|nr:hypothetical protein [Pyxidicoccus xibeiensis]MCP3137555.1 hypothetical protein [Pyxidicoccus xibeiensis]